MARRRFRKDTLVSREGENRKRGPRDELYRLSDVNNAHKKKDYPRGVCSLRRRRLLLRFDQVIRQNQRGMVPRR